MFALIAGLAIVFSLAASTSGAAPDGPVVFVGSSIFHRWTALSTQMAPLPIVNLAFDGAQTGDLLRLADSRVVSYKPRVVAYYGGSNDVDAGDDAAQIFDRIRQFMDRLRTALPEVRIVFVSVIRAPEKQSRWGVVDDVNRRVQAHAAGSKGIEFVDVNPLVFSPNGTPRFDLYLSDQLHFRPKAYEAFAAAIKPVLTNAFERR
ncbi:MAG TPA: GDSL-type esterase/lipase family protein [Vicinamibacterales bacterium]|nr:GDSL-type esterase/lipase family protein [Vicinamibacterales bacterium]